MDIRWNVVGGWGLVRDVPAIRAGLTEGNRMSKSNGAGTLTRTPTTTATGMRPTLRDRIREAEKLSHPLTVELSSGSRFEGIPTEVGIDFAEFQTEDRPVDVALFHIVSAAW